MSIFILTAIVECLGIGMVSNSTPSQDNSKIAAIIAQLMYTTEKNAKELKQKLHETVHTSN
jgi:predicted regulator of Ras-like GTPase activity (Roadblock/LC7/MglB family)